MITVISCLGSVGTIRAFHVHPETRWKVLVVSVLNRGVHVVVTSHIRDVSPFLRGAYMAPSMSEQMHFVRLYDCLLIISVVLIFGNLGMVI
jgi:dTDP-4-dehydrorhamnose 3,5-epimerase-like enzyme